MTQRGYAGRKFAGRRRVLDAHTPGMPGKHEAWPGVHVPVGFHIESKSVKPDKPYEMTAVVRL